MVSSEFRESMAQEKAYLLGVYWMGRRGRGKKIGADTADVQNIYSNGIHSAVFLVTSDLKFFKI